MKISVYITSYNQKDLLGEAIDSVLVQTLPPHQIIIADDASTDGSQEFIQSYADRYPGLITPVFHTQNLGVSATRNSALQQVRGEYVTYVDGDDRLLPQKLEKEADVLRQQPQAQIAFSNVYIINSLGERIDLWARRSRPPEGDVFAHTFAREFPGRRLFRNELVDFVAWKQSGAGWYDPQLRIYEDYDLRIRLTRHLRTAYVDEPLSEYRRHQGSLRTSQPQKYLQAFEYICRKNMSLLDILSEDQRVWVNQRLNTWRAELWRRKTLQKLEVGDGVLQRYRHAWKPFRLAWKYEKRLPLPFLIRALTTPRFYNIIQSAVHGWRARAVKNLN
jgi:glycosyltransferase involved in cell wall biosynthesis